MSRRSFIPDVPNHVYQISVDKGTLFYGEEDCLVLFTIQSVFAARFGITVHALCYMLNHIHQMASARSEKLLANYIGSVNALYVKEYNNASGRTGSLFKSPFGSAVKDGEKRFRSCFNYIANNAPEKGICRRAVDYRWNFLPYSVSGHPYSCEYRKSKASRNLRLAMEIVDDFHGKGLHLGYDTVHRLKEMLNIGEWRIVSDHIIVKYMFIRFDLSAEYYGSVEHMLKAPDFNLGEEWELNEDYSDKGFKIYYRMIRIMYGLGYYGRKRFPHSMKPEERDKIIRKIASDLNARYFQLARFFHLDIEEVKSILRFR